MRIEDKNRCNSNGICTFGMLKKMSYKYKRSKNGQEEEMHARSNAGAMTPAQ